ncbi:hypothetical protein KOAAANKH_02396 [Brevundimonas sp. NIBR10]|uniref:hypothetical protein n=1 Tax=Brevundimonas sp. NIBR10 TaxID=3015997 RepID=UPI0022F183C8|nr:hypothetical protein [Brevundimonas sp. NIBR10]WGM47519.1 hypothetical protein KOAAANKH_02396 [Brevundimonas sp. NIBR10]
MILHGTPSEQLPDVLGTGETAVRFVFFSLSARHPDGRDAEYIAWHSLDHRPEQYRLPQIRNALRLVSTPACRAARAASAEPYDAADHVMTYMFTDEGGIPGFNTLGNALNEGGRMPIRLPSVGFMTSELVGKVAADRAVAGADVIPWRPALGVYLMIERGQASPASLVEIPGVAGVWWFDGLEAPAPYNSDARGLRITYCFLDADPVATAEALRARVTERWASGEVQPLLAAPFFVIVPFEWDRYLPT